jgi:hypothetical protein
MVDPVAKVSKYAIALVVAGGVIWMVAAGYMVVCLSPASLHAVPSFWPVEVPLAILLKRSTILLGMNSMPTSMLQPLDCLRSSSVSKLSGEGKVGMVFDTDLCFDRVPHELS